MPIGGCFVTAESPITAVALNGAAAYFSLRGMAVLFPGQAVAVMGMSAVMEAAKLVGAGWLAAHWNTTARIWRGVLVALIGGVAVINAAGVFSQLVAAHVGERGAVMAATEIRDAELASRIEVASDRVADLDRRLGQIDQAVEGAAKRGKTQTALAAMEEQRKARAGLASERENAAATWPLKSERASVGARGRQEELETAPIRYVAELFGGGDDSEKAIRLLILLTVLTCDALAIALTTAVGQRPVRN